MPILQTEKISVNFGGLWAVRGVDFAIEPQEVIGLIGPNGSGKTTFLNIISGIYRATEGRVILNGEDVTRKKPFEIFRRGIARTYQASRLCWDLSVADNILTGLISSQKANLFDTVFRPVKVNEEIYQGLEEAMELLSYFNSDLVKHRYLLAKNIPHIDRRRIEICRALAGHPKILLLDEVTAGLNDEETMTMIGDIDRIRERLPDIAIIIIEHDMQVMREVPQRIVVFNVGEKIAEGSYQQIISDRAVIDAYLGKEAAV
ncbi:MAG: ABC transporter ATP-binding protein [Clostridia bacterium]|nr:ABC transporter ATP-binding protein [Clostridia bacterium]